MVENPVDQVAGDEKKDTKPKVPRKTTAKPAKPKTPLAE